jgi:uncharacterized protein YbjT (DUF2867 family)
MKVLITGGTGYVGSYLRTHIRQLGHDVRLLVRRNSVQKVTSPDDYDIVTGDIFDTNACLRACDGVDAIVHLVGIIREFPAEGITFDQYHRVATANMLNGARRCGVERFVHMSALGTRDDASSVYHRTRRAGEKLVEASKCRWTIFRPSVIFGIGDHFLPQVLDLAKWPVTPVVGGDTVLRPVAVENVCEAFGHSISMPETQGEVYDLGGADEITFREVIEKVSELAGGSGRFINVPAWLLKPVVAILDRYPSFPITLDQLRMLNEPNTCEVDHFVKTFRIEPASFRAALPDLVRTLLGQELREAVGAA